MLFLRQTKDGIGMRVLAQASMTGHRGQLCRQVAWADLPLCYRAGG